MATYHNPQAYKQMLMGDTRNFIDRGGQKSALF